MQHSLETRYTENVSNEGKGGIKVKPFNIKYDILTIYNERKKKKTIISPPNDIDNIKHNI